ncbi:hypothetical protein BBJ28_00025441 [Nothophytophthora sp. Chile5]|nr:hypothetical protein BBJ28_00025441 [Nothophytophthora sp. Chile5]
MRCFPHCCPDHVSRGFCGCSLNLLVTFLDGNAVPDPDEILVCARFEAAGSSDDSATPARPKRSPSGQMRAALPEESTDGMVTALAHGEEVTLPAHLLGASYSSSMEDIWMLATRESEGKQQHASEFERKAHPAQEQGRRMDGVASSDILRGNDIDEEETVGDDAEANESKKVEEDENASFWQLDAKPRFVEVAEKAQHLQLLRCFLEAAALDSFLFVLPYLDEHIRTNWFHSALVGRVSRARIQELASGFSLATFQVAAPLELLHSPDRKSRSEAEYTQFKELEEGVQGACVYLLLELFTSPEISELLRISFGNEACLNDGRGPASTANQEMPSKAQMREQFVQLVSELYGSLERAMLRVQSSDDSNRSSPLPALVDDMLSLVYSQPRYTSLRRGVSALLLNNGRSHGSAPANRLFRVFVAQVRETFIAQQRCHQQQLQRPPSAVWTTATTDRAAASWSRRWVVEPSSIRLAPSSLGPDWHQHLPLLPLLLWTRMLVCVDVQVDTDAIDCCSIRSGIPDANRGVAPMQLVLDGRKRVFRVLPNGVASLAVTADGCWSIGDYTGAFLSERRALEVVFFAVARGESNEDTHERTNEERKEQERQRNSLAAVRRVLVTLMLQDRADAEPPWLDGRCFAQCMVAEATYASHGDETGRSIEASGGLEAVGGELAEISSAARVQRLQMLHWTPVMELRASYVGVPAS